MKLSIVTGIIVLITVSLLLWSKVESVGRQNLSAIDLRVVCSQLRDIQQDVARLERLESDKNAKRILGDLGRHLRALNKTMNQGLLIAHPAKK